MVQKDRDLGGNGGHMILNKSTAGHFYGKRPPLAGNLGPLGGSNIALGAAGKDVAAIFIPGSVGAQLIGSMADKLGDKAGQVISKKFPTLGAVLYFVTDAIDFVLKPVSRYYDSLVTGIVTYLPEDVANKMLDYMSDNKGSLTADAVKDTLYAQYQRLKSTNSQVKDLKEGRDSILALAFGGVLDLLGIGSTADRVANTLYKQAVALGAKDYQAGAAIGYGVINGLTARGLPDSIKINTPAGPITVKAGTGASTYVLSVPEVASTYLSKLGLPVQYTNKWIEDQFEEKQGLKRSADDVSSESGGKSASGLLLPAAAVLAFVLLTRKGGKKEAA